MIIKTGLVLAAAAATLVVTGCASQQPAPAAQPVAMTQPAASCKGHATCKQVIVQKSCAGT